MAVSGDSPVALEDTTLILNAASGGSTVPRIRVEVVYARVDEQVIEPVELAPGATVAQAIAGSGLLARFTEIDLSRQALGIFGRRVRANDVVEDGDRVEIYRPLSADPKELRRRRARKSQAERS